MAGVAELFHGGHIIDKSNKEINLNDDKYKGKIIGLYFSAHWCPPCRQFTPVLTEFYNKYSKEKNFEIIFISSDRDEDSFNGYYNDMPWLALDYKERNIKKNLGEIFHVEGIPKLILLDADSKNIICDNARTKIQEQDTNGENFPWKS